MRRTLAAVLTAALLTGAPALAESSQPQQQVKIDRKVKREFFLSLRSGDFKKAEELIASGKVPVDFRNKFSQTPLYYAADADSVEFANFLIEHGADVNAKDNYGYTPLHLAAIYNRPKIAKLLIEHGAKVNEKDNYGNTPLHYCGTTFGTAPVAKVLLENGADPTVKNNRGKTPLQLANEVKNYPVARLITKYLEKRK